MSARLRTGTLDPFPTGAPSAPRTEDPMSVSQTLTKEAPRARPVAAVSPIDVPQYRIRGILAIWAAAAVPMAALAWLAAPALEDRFAGTGNVPLFKALNVCLSLGLVWQFLLVAGLVWREQRSFRWSTLREALWLRSPRSPRSGRVGGKVWLVLIPLTVAFAAESAISLQGPENRDLGAFLGTDAGKAFMHGAWGWYALILVWFVFNTVLGEELLFRGFLLPRMNGVFGRRDWLANGVLFAGYHLHTPWVIPTTLFDAFIVAYPTKRYRSAWIGIVVHSVQSLFLGVLIFTLVV
jgi:membrane protease YdiL (CAAX protease family)